MIEQKLMSGTYVVFHRLIENQTIDEVVDATDEMMREAIVSKSGTVSFRSGSTYVIFPVTLIRNCLAIIKEV